MPEMCRSCHAEIDWASNEDGTKTNPIDHDSADVPGGNLIVWRDVGGVLRYRYLRKADAGRDLKSFEHLGRSHFATCPNARQHRKATA